MASGSSAKKVAKLAQKGKGRSVRFQGGSLFPISVLVVVLLGIGLIVYGRISQPDPDASPPTIDDHWHAAFGIYACDAFLPKVSGAAEGRPGEAGDFEMYRNVGVHSHDDGVIHWHPFGVRAVGRRARLGVFLDTYGVKLSDTKLEIPAAQGGYLAPDGTEVRVFEEGETKCNGQDAELSVTVWPSYLSTADSRGYVTKMRDAHIDHDHMVFVIAFVPKGTTIPQPEWAANLPALGAIDTGATAPSSTVAGETTTSVAGDGSSTTVAGDTGTTSSASTSSTEPATTLAGSSTTSG